MLTELYQQAAQLIERKSYQAAHQCLLKILSQDRSYADAYYLMAVIAAEHGNFTKAITIAEKAISIGAKAQYLVFLAKLCIQIHDHVKAKQWADKAHSAANLSGAQLDNLGVVYSQVGQHRLAITCFEKALNAMPSAQIPAQLHTNIASSYKFCGDFGLAKHHYQQALDKDPRCYLALWSLASLGELPSHEQEHGLAQALQDESEQSDCTMNGKLHIAHTLVRLYEQQGNFEQAFEVLTKVKAEKKRQLGYQIRQDLSLFDALEKRFSVDQIKASANERANTGFDNSEAIFIVGMPRTGTTVVERLLSQPDNIKSAGEMQHFSVALKQISQTSSSNLLDLEVISSTKDIDWQQLGEKYIASTRAITGDTAKFIDKMPLNFLYVGFILSALPKAKVIWLDRSLEDTLVSNFRQLFAIDFPFYHYSYDLSDCYRYYQAHHQLAKTWQTRFPENFYRLDYEAFVNAPEHQDRKSVV